MIDLFTPDDRAVLAESFGREPDDALLSTLLDTAREIATKEYHDDLSRYASRLEIYRNRLAQYEHDFAAWSVAAQDFSRQSRRYEGALSVWRSAANKEDMPEPPPPVDPGAKPERPEAPIEPTAPTDASAVALLMAEQRAAVARARLEPKPEIVIDLGIERAEIVNEAFDLVMSRLAVNQPVAQEPAQLLPPVDTLMSDYGSVGGVAPDLADIMLPDEPLAAAVERMTPGLDELLDMAQLLSEPSFEAAIVTIPTERFNEWTERLFAERGVLRTRRGTDDENLARENLISRVATVFARVGAKR